MASENTAKSASKKEKKAKRKSLGDVPIPSAEKAGEPDTSTSTAPTKKTKKRKVDEVKEDEVVEEEKQVLEAKSKKSKKTLKEQPQPVVEDEGEVPQSKKKKERNEKGENGLARPGKPTPAIPPKPASEPAAAPSKASTTAKTPATSDKPSKKPKKVKAKEPSPEPEPEFSSEEEVAGAASSPEPVPAPRQASSTSKPAKIPGKPSKKSKMAEAKEPSPSPEPEPEIPSEDEDADAGSGDDEEDLHLHGFSTDDDDSSDEDDAMDDDPAAFDIAKLPTVAKDDATVKRKLEKAKRQPTQGRGVIYLGRIPHGFYEDQMRGYFSQFGTVTRVRLSRNKKTGKSKHYGFVEFASSSVAKIVAETMDNYLIMGHILRCKLIPQDEVHPELWVGANRKWRTVPRDRLTRVEHNKPRTEDEQARAAKRLIKRQNERKRKLAEAGIKYDFEAVSYKKAKEAEA
ncbi:putative RNA recognition motif containing protein [Lyophyllum shimeji]|uniref:RNA recognition motif containing protein n=1 Tax=Lyophyllum shimeji TaxID=47721 RepID=A0A9P3PRA0_LYOSH|nr:putative RNA recognition motif containing protein [Lyophyllum shimeji]